MTIAPHIVQRFLSRSLDEFEWIKSQSDKDLDDAIAEINPSPNFHTKPFKHQKACFLLCYHFPRFFLLLDMGLGKSKIILDVLWQYKREGRFRKGLVVVPGLPHIAGWVEQAEVHRPEFSCKEIVGVTQDRRFLMQNDPADLHIINYPGLMMAASRQEKTGKRGAARNVLSKKTSESLQGIYDTIVCDESQKIKNRSSLQWKALNLLSAEATTCLALTGTPVGRNPEDFWAQYYFVDRGFTLGPSLTFYRDAYFERKQKYFGGFEWKLKKSSKDTLYKALKHRSVWYDESECADLPEKVYIKREVEFPEDFYAYYNSMIEEMRQAKGDYHEVESIFHRMRNISSGYLSAKDENEKTIQIPLPSNPKLEEVLGILEAMPGNSKCVIFYDYTFTAKMVVEELAKIGCGYEWLWSGTKDQLNSVKRFTNNKKCRVLVCQSKIGSSGLNLQAANYVIFMESPVSPIDRQQAEKRCHRQGQQANRVFYYDLVMKNTVDERILDFIKEGKDVFQALVKGEAKLWGLFKDATQTPPPSRPPELSRNHAGLVRSK